MAKYKCWKGHLRDTRTEYHNCNEPQFAGICGAPAHEVKYVCSHGHLNWKDSDRGDCIEYIGDGIADGRCHQPVEPADWDKYLKEYKGWLPE